MKLRKFMSVLTLALFLFPSMPFIAADPVLSVVVDEFYEPGEKVEVSGVAGAGAEVYLLVMFGEAMFYEETLTADEDGEFSTEFLLPEDASEGLYTVTVSSGEEDAEVGFTVVAEDAEEEEEVETEEEENVEAAEEEETETEETEEEEDTGEEETEEEETEEEETEEEETEETEEEETEETEEETAEEETGEEEGEEVPEEEVLAEEEAEEEEDEEETEDEELTTEEEAEQALGLDAKIVRAEEYLDKLEDMISNLEEEYPEGEYPEVNERLGEIKILLGLNDDEESTSASDFIEDAKAAYVIGDYNTAARNLAAARNILGRSKGLLTSLFKAHKIERLEKFQEQVQARIEGLTNKIEKLQNRLENSQMVMAALKAKEKQMMKLMERLEAGETEEVMDELEDVVEGVDEDLDDLDDEETAERFKAMNRVEARVRVLSKMAEKLVEKGEDTTELDEQVESAKGLMAEWMNRMQEGGDGELDDMLESAEEDLKGLGKWLKGLGKPEKTEAGNGKSLDKGKGNQS